MLSGDGDEEPPLASLVAAEVVTGARWDEVARLARIVTNFHSKAREAPVIKRTALADVFLGHKTAVSYLLNVHSWSPPFRNLDLSTSYSPSRILIYYYVNDVVSIGQGGTINAFYQGECQGSAPCEFTVMFRNANFVPGCDAAFTGGSCPASDDNQFSSGPEDTIRARGLESRATTPDMFTNGTHIPGPCRFRTNKGSVLDAPFGGYIGEKVVDYVPINQTKWDLDIENHEYLEDEDESQYDYMLDNLRSEEEWVTEQV